MLETIPLFHHHAIIVLGKNHRSALINTQKWNSFWSFQLHFASDARAKGFNILTFFAIYFNSDFINVTNFIYDNTETKLKITLWIKI